MRLVLIIYYSNYECSGEIHAPLECESKEELYCKIKDGTKALQDAIDQWYAKMDLARKKGKIFMSPRPPTEFDFAQWGWHHKLDLDLFWTKESDGDMSKRSKNVFIEPVIYTVDEWFEASAAMKL